MRLEFGGRVGYGIALGSVTPGRAMHDYFKGSVPTLAEFWLRYAGFALGVYGGINFGIDGKALDDCGSGCSATNWRIGLQFARHFNDAGVVDPWLGLGLGFEASSLDYSDTFNGVRYSYDNTYNAFPELTLQGGIDFGTDPIGIGPFVSISYGSYGSRKGTIRCESLGCAGVEDSASSDISDTSAHGWFLFGIRGYYLR